MLPHAVAVTADIDHVAVMHEAIDEGCRHDLVAEDHAPLLEALVRCEDSGSMLVAVVDELEEEHRTVAAQGQVADLIDDQKRRVAQDTKPPGELPGGTRGLERLDETDERAVIHAPSRLGGSDGEADRQVGLAHPWGS